MERNLSLHVWQVAQATAFSAFLFGFGLAMSLFRGGWLAFGVTVVGILLLNGTSSKLKQLLEVGG